MSKLKPRVRQLGPEAYADKPPVLPPLLAEMADENEPAFGEIIDGVIKAFSQRFDLTDPGAVKAIVDAARRRYEATVNPMPYDRYAMMEEVKAARAAREAESVVYYFRIGDRVKIGTTTNLAERAKVFRPEEIMATEPGGLDAERRRHGQFAHFRLGQTEWFRLEGSLREHIAGIREAGDGCRQAG